MLRSLLVLVLVLAAALAPLAAAHSHKKKNLEIVHPWTPEVLQKGVTSARVFMTVKNSGGTPDRLISASTPRAERIELAAGDGTANDANSAAAFSIGPGMVLVLHAKGPHLVLTGVKKAFQAYDDFKMTLVFEKAGRVVIDVVVEESGGDHPH